MRMPAITVCNLNRVSCPNLKTLLDKCNENISFCGNETNILSNASLIHDRFCRGGPPSGVKPPMPDKGQKIFKNEQNILENQTPKAVIENLRWKPRMNVSCYHHFKLRMILMLLCAYRMIRLQASRP